MLARTRTVIVMVSVVLLGLVAVSAAVAARVARDAMVHEVQRTEELAATERAADVEVVLGRATGLLRSLADRPTFRAGLDHQDAATLEGDLSVLVGMNGVGSAAIAEPSGLILALVTAPKFDPSQPAFDLDTAIAGGGTLRIRFVVKDLFPRLTAPLGGLDGTVSLVEQGGRVLASNSKVSAPRVQAPEVLHLIRGGGSATYWSPVLGQERIGVVAPVAGQPWAVVVGVPEASARASADDLVRRLAVVLVATALASAAMLAVLLSVLNRSRRVVEQRRATAESMAETDVLTELGNRRRLERAIDELPPTGDEVCLVLLDVDNFKRLNDELGHLAGDDALRLVARSLTAAVRADDLVVRWGGDEFAVLLPGGGAAVADTVARISTAVAAVLVPGFGSLRASVGVAVGSPELSTLLRRADLGLYEDKRRAAMSQLPR